MVAEYIPVGGFSDSGAPPKWTGWYFDLFPDRHDGAEAIADFVADYFTLTNADEVRYLGAEVPRLGVFVVDTNGAPRAMVGPVAKGYELAGPIATRYTDESARTAKGKSAPWRTYAAPEVAAPPIDVSMMTVCDSAHLSFPRDAGPPPSLPGDTRFFVESAAHLGPVTLTLLDHHGDALAQPVTRDVGPTGAVFAFRLAAELNERRGAVEAVHVYVHDLGISGGGRGRFDFVVPSKSWGPTF
jgi:hypothetical protein